MVETTTVRNENRPDMKSRNENSPEAMSGSARASGMEQSHRHGSDKASETQGARGTASNDESSGSYDTLKQDFDKLREDMGALAKSFTENQQHVVKRFTNDLVKEGQSLLNTAKTRSETMMKSATDSSRQAATQFESRIKERPFMSMLLSFLVGLIIARLMTKD